MFQIPENKKEKYFKLTKQGENAVRCHAKAHLAWEERDSLFLQSIPGEEKTIVSAFLTNYNRYLEQLIKEKMK